MDSLLDLNATAALLGTSPATVVRWVDDGTLSCLVLHRGKRKLTRRFHQEDVMRIVNPAEMQQEGKGEG